MEERVRDKRIEISRQMCNIQSATPVEDEQIRIGICSHAVRLDTRLQLLNQMENLIWT